MKSDRPKTERASWVAGIVSALLAVIALIFTIWPHNPEAVHPQVVQNASSAGVQIGVMSGNVTVVNSNPVSPQSENGSSPVIISGPLGFGGIEYVKYIRDADSSPGARFYSVKCRYGRSFDVLFEPHNGNKWYLVPPSDPEEYYKGTSVQEFATVACTSPPMKPESVISIEPSVGSTASGIRSYKITCRDHGSYSLQRASDGAWFMLDGSASFSRYKGTEPSQFAALFCSDH